MKWSGIIEGNYTGERLQFLWKHIMKVNKKNEQSQYGGCIVASFGVNNTQIKVSEFALFGEKCFPHSYFSRGGAIIFSRIFTYESDLSTPQSVGFNF